MGLAGQEREAFPVAHGIANGSITMTHAIETALRNRPILLGRMTLTPPPIDNPPLQANQLLEESILAVLRQNSPTYLKMEGASIRYTLVRAYVRFLLERTRGNQARAAEVAGFNRNTLRRLVRVFAIDWQHYAAK